MMAEPEIAKTAPYAVELEAGRYWWCACGKSQKQPFCDGSHKGSEFTPVQVQIDEPKKVFLCGCKRSANAPFCDGSHNKL
jgi:CDGSH iron-sulfur domain-containing protein 3